MEDENIPLCIDCKHHEKGRLYYFCRRPNKTSPVTGELDRKPCFQERLDIPRFMDKCGSQGKYFEPKERKPSLWERIRMKLS